jgi:hypothetical protein
MWVNTLCGAARGKTNARVRLGADHIANHLGGKLTGFCEVLSNDDSHVYSPYFRFFWNC